MATLSEIVAPYPAAPALTALDVREAARAVGAPQPFFVVLDDDPTGTQSVSGLPVLTSWAQEDVAWALGGDAPAVYVMTNSRSLPPEHADRITREVVAAATTAAAAMRRRLAFVSRSDSTLRGHFPLEPQLIADLLEEAGQPVDGIILAPAFPEAGRVSVGGIHYTRIGEDFLPSGETEFARDATFGYTASSLAAWVEEKTRGAIRADEVLTPDLTELRTRPEALVGLLMSAKDQQVIAPDIACEQDLLALSLALIAAEARGRTFVYRVGPPFMRARLGQEVRAPLSAQEVEALRSPEEGADGRGAAKPEAVGGLVVVGSHVALTTRQLERLVADSGAPVLDVEVGKILDPASRDDHLKDLIAQAVELLGQGTLVVRTSRTLVTGIDAEDSLEVSRRVSTAVVETVQGIMGRIRPRFVLAKGGITSSDVASRGLGIRRAQCVGPMLPGIVSLWAAQDGPARGVPYIVFPGNVGDEHALAAVVKVLLGQD
ncbi:four-carbon acid sugar kinase family protein [Actinomyces respiraculi]|uniref:four-carbon acid sugar kinase family protein n=1 Tax=Actinomyces respiraculi TaxID=2744574 RepID=UPI001423FA2D|nr:four-carbon acid sugar kinase family protein [Actinomyces respiraculi]